MKKQKIFLAALATLTFAPVASPLLLQSAMAVQQADQGLAAEKLALGATLNSQQVQETISLLGAGNVTPENTISVDGVMIDRYLNIGSDASTDVYSSVYIKPQTEGTGIQVQIVTPQNITAVSATTYQNAAITAGAKNALIKIGTIIPVTGEGALTGLYALLESQGVAVKQHDVQTAQKEITVVNNVKTETGLTDDQVNVIIAEIKKEVAAQVQNNGQVNTTEIVNNVINNVVNQTTINGDGNTVDNSVETNVNISNETKQELEQYANDFAQTDAASSEDTVGQLDLSIDGKSWKELLSEQEPSQTVEDILALGEPDFSDETLYHPIVQAMYNRFLQSVKEGIRIDDLYAHTFILEKIQPEMTVEAKAAIYKLRELMYQYTASFEDQMKTDLESQGYDFVSVKDQWLNKLEAADQLRNSDPHLAEIVQLIANATGYAPEVYSYMDIEQEDKIIRLTVAEDTLAKVTPIAYFEYDLETGVISEVDQASLEAKPLSQDTFRFEELYQVAVENNYQSTAIPADYTIPGYTPVEETTLEETTLEESTGEENPEESSSVQLPEEPVTPESPSSDEVQDGETPAEVQTSEAPANPA